MRGTRPLLHAATGLAALTLSACGGGGGSPAAPSPGGTPPPADNRVVLDDPSFSANIQEIFDRRSCSTSGCHGAALQGGLDLRSGASFAALVDVPATSEPFLRVSPGDPDNSYLVIKVEGSQSVGSRMPLTGGPLDDIDLANIRNWIAQGAQNN